MPEPAKVSLSGCSHCWPPGNGPSISSATRLLTSKATRHVPDAYFRAYHCIRDEQEAYTDEFVSGRFIDRFECRGGEWRIAERCVALDWFRTEKGRDPKEEGFRGRGYGGVPTNPEDPSDHPAARLPTGHQRLAGGAPSAATIAFTPSWRMLDGRCSPSANRRRVRRSNRRSNAASFAIWPPLMKPAIVVLPSTLAKFAAIVIWLRWSKLSLMKQFDRNPAA